MMPLCSKEDQSLVQPSQVGIQQSLRCFRIFQTSMWSWQMWQTCVQRTRTFLSWELEWGKALRVYHVTLDETQKNSAFLMGVQDPSSMINTRGTEAVQQEMVKTREKAVGNKAGVRKLNFWECQTKEWILWERETRAVALGHENMSGLECNADSDLIPEERSLSHSEFKGSCWSSQGHPEFHPGLVFILWFLPMVQKKKRSSQICNEALWKKPHPHERIEAMAPLKLLLLVLKPRNKNSAGKAIPVSLAYSCYAVMQGFTTSLIEKSHTHTNEYLKWTIYPFWPYSQCCPAEERGFSLGVGTVSITNPAAGCWLPVIWMQLL